MSIDPTDPPAEAERVRMRALASANAAARKAAMRTTLHRVAQSASAPPTPRPGLPRHALAATASGAKPDPDLVRRIAEQVNRAKR